MLPSALVVFREVFEIVLIVGIILAATKNIPQRKAAIALGFAGGIAGSALIALFTAQISNMAEGLGQEYFNAGILFTAAIFIGWTVLWMKKHARHIKSDFMKLGEAVAVGKTPLIMLSAIIAITMLREGAEIVLFTYGMLAAGQDPLVIAMGSSVGLISGLGVGLLLYFGLIKLSVRVFFQVTSWLLIFLVAGMMSQGFGFLVQAGAFEGLSQILWDSSGLLAEDGIIGQSLGTLIGYTARPTAIQIIVYLLTLTTLILTMKAIEKNMTHQNLSKVTAAAIFLALIFPTPALASKDVTSPYVEKGELEFTWKGGVQHDDDDDGQDGAWKQKFEVEYGLTERVQVELAGEVEEEGDSDRTEFSAVEIESKVQLTERGQYWVDVGVKGAYAYNTTGGADAIEGKLLLAKDTGDFSHKANLKLEREVGEDAEDEFEGGASWSSRYRYTKEFEPGFEYYADFGDLSDTGDFDEQGHQIGPVAYGKLGEHVGYEAGYLVGLSDSAPDGEVKAILKYEIHY